MPTKYKMKKLENGNIRTCEVVLSFPHVFEPNDDGKYGAAVLFPEGADLSVLEKEIERVKKETWGEKIPKNLRVGLRDQEEKEDEYEGYVAGRMFLNTTSTKRVKVVDKNREPVEDEDDLFPGCNAIVSLTVRARNPKKGEQFSPVIYFGLQSVQLLGGGTRIAGGVADPMKEFEEVDGLDDDASADSIFGEDEE